MCHHYPDYKPQGRAAGCLLLLESYFFADTLLVWHTNRHTVQDCAFVIQLYAYMYFWGVLCDADNFLVFDKDDNFICI